MAIYAIGDIHGCKATFQLLLQQIRLQREDTLVLLGDYIDRGPDTKGVFDTIFSYQQAGFDIRCLRGNHEQIFLEATTGYPPNHQRLLGAGGAATLASFGVLKAEEVDRKYLQFIMELPYYLEIGPYIFVHGGLNFSHPDPLSAEEDMLWARAWYENINADWLGERWIIHGHTPVPLLETQEQVVTLKKGGGQVLNLDNGCVYPNQPNLGQLTAFDLTNQRLVSVAYQA